MCIRDRVYIAKIAGARASTGAAGCPRQASLPTAIQTGTTTTRAARSPPRIWLRPEAVVRKWITSRTSGPSTAYTMTSPPSETSPAPSRRLLLTPSYYPPGHELAVPMWLAPLSGYERDTAERDRRALGDPDTPAKDSRRSVGRARDPDDLALA